MKFISIFLLSFFSINSYSEEANSEESKDPCIGLYQGAELVMRSRQAGVPMPKVMAVFSGQTEAWKNVVELAYSTPKWSSEARKQEAETEFANKIYLMCSEAQ